ncbi:MAG TPA: hypothetical protein VGC61_01600 [Pyrinomonadaceae bacterium]|jgi:hypothetical protein
MYTPNTSGRGSQTNTDAGAASFLGLVLVVLVVGLLWSISTTVLLPALSLTLTLAGTTLAGFSDGLTDLVIDLAWGIGVGLFVGWVRLWKRKRDGAVEKIVDAVATPEVVSSASLGWMYVLMHVGAGVLASLIVWLLGLAFPSQILAGSTDTMLAGLAYLQASGWLAGGGGGPDGAGTEAIWQIVLILLFLLLLALPVLFGFIGAFTAISLKGAASGAVGTAGKSLGLVLFLVLTRLRGGRFYLPVPPATDDQPVPRPVPEPFDLAQFIDDFRTRGPAARKRVVDDYFSWLKQEGIEPDAQTIGENAPRYKHPGIYELARRLNFELAQRDPWRVDPRLESWKKYTEQARTYYEKGLREELFGPGWLKRAVRQGLGAGALSGLVTALLVAAALALLRG